jgi:hypothetical protein
MSEREVSLSEAMALAIDPETDEKLKRAARRLINTVSGLDARIRQERIATPEEVAAMFGDDPGLSKAAESGPGPTSGKAKGGPAPHESANTGPAAGQPEAMPQPAYQPRHLAPDRLELPDHASTPWGTAPGQAPADLMQAAVERHRAANHVGVTRIVMVPEDGQWAERRTA